MTAAAPTPAAMAAFLRGIERRAALLAELQCGDPAAGDAALDAAMRAFRAAAAAQPLARWPALLWGLLLAAPQLRRALPRDVQAETWRPLATLGSGLRAALLVRLVAGLDQDAAAAVLGVSPVTGDQAARHALATLAPDDPAREAWATWDGKVQHALKSLPAARLAQLARLREQALSADAPAGPAASRAPRSATPRRGRWRPVAWTALVLCAGALLATFLRPAWFTRAAHGDPRIRTIGLPPAEAPAARFDAGLRAWSHRDFVLLADPTGLRAARRLPLLAWYAAQLSTQAAAAGTTGSEAGAVDATGAQPPTLPVPPSTVEPDGAATRLPQASTADVVLPADAEAAVVRMPAPLQPGLRARASRWFAWTPEQRNAFRQREAVWDASPAAVRGEQRESYAAWRGLDAESRRQVVAAAQALAALPPEQREGLRTRFIAQDASTQRGWLLGPGLGADYPRLQPLIAQLPVAQHAPLLAVLRGLPPEGRADLARLAQRTPPQERAELLRELLSTSDANRSAWLQARAAR